MKHFSTLIVNNTMRKQRATTEEMQKDIATFNRVFNKFPNEFTSHAFAEALVAAGVKSQIKMNQSVLLNYLCIPKSGRFNKTWKKRESIALPTGDENKQRITEEDCIAFLKSTGRYKISRIILEEV